MALIALCKLFDGLSENGSSYLAVIGAGQRYNPMSSDTLKSNGFYRNIESIDVVASALADANVILFANDDYSGAFTQLTESSTQMGNKGLGDGTANVSGNFRSAMLIASNVNGAGETRISFKTIFLQQWESFIDANLNGTQVDRVGEPTLTWEMFPTDTTCGGSGLNPELTYLKIYQPLHVNVPHWFDYSASLTYFIFLYPDDNNHLRALGIQWECWVESGVKHDDIYGQMAPQIAAGLGTLQDKLNNQLANFDAALGTVTDIYYLPGTQTAVMEGLSQGVTTDDVTIVIQHT